MAIDFNPQLSDEVTLPGGYRVSLKPRKNPLDRYLADIPTPEMATPDPGAVTPPPAAAPPALPSETQPPAKPSLAVAMGSDPTGSSARLKTLQDQYNSVGQQSIGSRLARALATFAPIALAAKLGGTYAASGAAQGAAEATDVQREQQNLQRKNLMTQMEDERQRQERMAERQLTYSSQVQAIQERANAAEQRAQSAKEVADIRAETQRQIGELQNQFHQGMLDVRNRGVDAQLRQHGFKTDDQGNIQPLDESELSPAQKQDLADKKALQDLRAAQTEHAQAQAEATASLNDPNSPRFKQAQQRLEAATARLNLSKQQFEMHAYGTNNGQALPGAMIADNGQPVGTAFQGNVRPTGLQRNKANMAQSADEQMQDIKEIVQRRKDVFGPAAGRTTDFTVWLGSEDPDAKRFLNARTIAADHMAGTFGGRSEAALQALDAAIGQFKDNPAAVLAGLDQLNKANNTFIQAGTVRTAGSDANGKKNLGNDAGITVRVQTKDGKTGTIAKDQLQKFLKDNPGSKQLQ